MSMGEQLQQHELMAPHPDASTAAAAAATPPQPQQQRGQQQGRAQPSLVESQAAASETSEEEELLFEEREEGECCVEEDDDEEEEDEIMTSVRLPFKQQSSSEASVETAANARGRRSVPIAAAVTAAGGGYSSSGGRPHTTTTTTTTSTKPSLKAPPSARVVRHHRRVRRGPTCGMIRRGSPVATSEDYEADDRSSRGSRPLSSAADESSNNASFGGNDADDEGDEDDSVFAHVIIGSGSISSSESSSGHAPYRPRSGGGGGGGSSGQQQQQLQQQQQHRQSRSFELATSPQQRQKHLRFLRTVHSAQARLTEATQQSSTETSYSVGSCETTKSLDCPQIRRNQVTSAARSQFLSVETATSRNNNEDDDEGDDVSIGGLGKRIRKLSSRTIEFCDSIDELQGLRTTPSPNALAVQSASTAVDDVMGNELKKTSSSNEIVSSEPVPSGNHHQRQHQQRHQQDCMRVPQFSVSVESDAASGLSHESVVTVVTAIPIPKRQQQEESNMSSSSRTNVQSTSIASALSSWASSLMSMRHRSSSTESRFSKHRGNSQDRPLGLKKQSSSRGAEEELGTPGGVGSGRKTFRRQDTPRCGREIEQYASPPQQQQQQQQQQPPSQQPQYPQARRSGALNARLSHRLAYLSSDGGSSSSQSQSLGSLEFQLTPPSIVCTEPGDYDTSNSSNATPNTLGGGRGSSFDSSGRPECDTPIMDEFAQFLNASIHPPNELSVPRCYPDPCPPSPTLLHPMSMPGSRRSSATRGSMQGGESSRSGRSLSLGYQQQMQLRQQQSGSLSPSPIRSAIKSFYRGGSALSPTAAPTSAPGLASPSSTSRPVLRRESAQDFGDDVDVDNPRLRLNLPKQPPDLKIDLLSETSSATTPSSASPYFHNASSLFPYGVTPDGTAVGVEHGGGGGLAAPPGSSAFRRLSNCQRAPPISRNKSAPATPLSRSVSNVSAQQHQQLLLQQQQRLSRSPSKDGYLMVPERLRGSSLPEGQHKQHHHGQQQQQQQEGDLYRLRQFTVSNKRIVKRSDSLQPRRSAGSSLHSSASSSLSHSHSGRSSLRSSTEDDDNCTSSKNSLATPRYTVLMLGATEVGKTLLTNQFMSASDVGAYSSLTEDEYDEKSVSVLLEGEEAELVFIDHPSSEISVENAMATYIPDAMLVVYSVVTSDSLSEAEETLQYLWRTHVMGEKAVILVGNKTDLVRSRAVNIADAKAIAMSYECKYSETSAALNHNVDELLVGLLTQIRLKLAEKTRASGGGHRGGGGGMAGLLGNRKGMGGGGAGSGGSGSSAGTPTGGGGGGTRRRGLSLLTASASSASAGGGSSAVSRRKSAGVRVKGILDKVLGGDSKSKSCDDLHVL